MLPRLQRNSSINASTDTRSNKRLKLTMFLQLCIIFLVVLTSLTAADVGEPLLLTSLLKQGKYEEARNLSRVTPDLGNITSYSGFFTIDEECESNMFFWFIPATNRSWEEAPLLIWQQGGPGTPSFYGLFQELGPFQHFNSSGLVKRQYSWSDENNLLIFDMPGVAYSFSGKKCYPEDELVVAENWYKALMQFYQLFPELQKNNFVLSGQSYAGHFIPLYAYTIHKNNPTAEVKVNLTGMLMMNAWSDPVNQNYYSSLYYNLGLIDDKQREVYEHYEKLCVESINDENWDNALNNCSVFTTTSYKEFVGQVDIYNMLAVSGLEKQNWEEFVQTDQVRKQFHVGNLTYSNGREIFYILVINMLKSVKPYVEQLLEHYRIVFANGQFDLVCPYSLMVKFLRSMNWSGSSAYLEANRTKWCHEQEQVGYYKQSGNLCEMLVRGASHYIPTDKPAVAYQLINSLTSGFPNHPLHAIEDCDVA